MQIVAFWPSALVLAPHPPPGAAEEMEEPPGAGVDPVGLGHSEVGVVPGDRGVGQGRRSARKMQSTTVIGYVIHQRMAAGFVALTTVPGTRYDCERSQ